MFEIIRASQIEDNVIHEGDLITCIRCDNLIDIFIKAYDKDEMERVFICKHCFCNSNSPDYCIPFCYLGEVGYMVDNKGIKVFNESKQRK